MEPAEPSRGIKRRLAAADEDDDGRERKPRFPKGKKAKHRDPAAERGDAAPFDIDSVMNPELAAERRARQRHQREKDDAQGSTAEVKVFEVRYDDGVNFVDDGIRIEPFNLEQEREEGYFDENGNFVEYARGNELKDKGKEKEEDFQDLSSDDIGKIKRRIANMLEPGETVLQALKRLKNTSTDERGKMTEGTKRVFDELTEAAMSLWTMVNMVNVYSDDRETFEREAAGYERLAHARLGLPEVEEAATTEDNQTASSILEMDPGPSAVNTSTATTSLNDDDSNFDMFGDDDIADAKGSDAKTVDASLTSGVEEAGKEIVGSDYVYDPSSGYYYSSSTGYYYDSNTGYYCSASTGTCIHYPVSMDVYVRYSLMLGYQLHRYSYDEQTGAYKEIQDVQTGTNNDELVYAVKE
ncbi:hypothetical protein PR202_ga15998 [Eleusine coracana subsp. coracana]|uniref:OCRE domain-containing protein n=1 Tax=Eleusine coracana subsp. coracana TaxID=191504 RepID=A0AAV5CLB8_ELECO|nr:hypothetical protein PR202_ga15998 [Eleusine coracana subsp. coracana]